MAKPSPKDDFSDLGAIDVPSDDFSDLGAIDVPRGTSEQNNPYIKDFLKGAAQGIENFGIGTYNLLPGEDIEKARWAPETTAAKVGEFASDVGTFFIPGLGWTKAAKYIPKLGEALNFLSKKPVRNFLSTLGGRAAEGSLIGAIQAPSESEKLSNALYGGGITAGTNLLGASLLPIFRNPFARAVAGAGIGGGVGGYFGGPVGAIAGMTMGSMAPSVAQKSGIFGKRAGLESLENVNPKLEQEGMEALQAGRRIGTNLTPAEAFGDPYLGRLEGEYAKTGKASAFRTEIGFERKDLQKTAINNLLNTIFDKSDKSKNSIRNLYEQAYKTTIKPEVFNAFRDDEIISAAFDKVSKSPALRKGLKNIPENNVAYLDQAKRAMDDMQNKALKAGENNEARIIGETKENLVKFLDKNAPGYAQARAEAQRSIIRTQLQKQMRKKELKGTDFYNTVLKNEDEFNKLVSNLKNVPDAQRQLKDMRLAWKNLINIDTARGAAGKAETSMTSAREAFAAMTRHVEELFGERRSIEALKFIHSPSWEKSFVEIQRIKDKKIRNDRWAALVGRYLGISGVASL